MTEYYSFEPGKLINPFPHPSGHRINTLYPIYNIPSIPKVPSKVSISYFTNWGEYYSLQTVLGSGSSFKPFRRPEGHSRNCLYAIRWCHYATIGPKNVFLILQMRVNITPCTLF